MELKRVEQGDSVAELTMSDASLLMTEIDKALVSYVSTPKTSLQCLQSHFHQFVKENQQGFPSASLFHTQASLLKETIDQLLSLECAFHPDGQAVLFSCLDALFQNAMALRLGGEYQQVQARSLSSQNACWQALSALRLAIVQSSPLIKYYAELSHSQTLDVTDELKRLAEFGRASFEVKEVLNGRLQGVFYFETSLPLAWLNQVFAELTWLVSDDVSLDEQRESVKAEVSEAPSLVATPEAASSPSSHVIHPAMTFSAMLCVFQSTRFSRHWRDAFLTHYTQYVQQQDYVAFADAIADRAQVDPAYTSFLVPRVDLSSWQVDQNSTFQPVRWQGSFYAVSQGQGESDNANAMLENEVEAGILLGRDVLPSILYQLDCLTHQLHFHCAEAKPLRLAVGQIYWENGQAFSEIEGQQVPFLLSSKVYSSSHAVCLLLPQQGEVNGLLVTQWGRSFVIPYETMRCVEAIALHGIAAPHQVKNVWLDKKGRMLIEPNLVNVSLLLPCVQKLRMETVPHPMKKGYYFGTCNGVKVAVAADLVVDINSYVSPQSFYFDHGVALQSRQFMPSLESYVEFVGLNSEVSGFRKTNSTGCFSVILEVDGLSAVLPFVSFDWYESLQSIESLELGSGSELSNDLKHEDLVVLDKKKYLSFITDYMASV